MSESKKPFSKKVNALAKEVNLKKGLNLGESETKKKRSSRQSLIPKVVANRMARRIVFTTGIPTVLGMGVFILSYYLIIKGITDVPPSLTLASSAICFLVGLLGLSYGILSASWDEQAGSFIGLENIRPNIRKLRSAFRPVVINDKKN